MNLTIWSFIPTVPALFAAAAVVCSDSRAAVASASTDPGQTQIQPARNTVSPGKLSQTVSAAKESLDQQLQRRVRRLLRDDPRTRPFAPLAVVQGGRVTLTGHTYYPADRELAQRTASTIVGGAAVQNLIVVDPNPDLEIARKLHDAFVQDPLVDGAAIAVTVIQGKVYLSGTASSNDEFERVDLLTRSIPGVVAISNKLEVSPSNNRAPVRAALPGRPYPYPGYPAYGTPRR